MTVARKISETSKTQKEIYDKQIFLDSTTMTENHKDVTINLGQNI